MNISLHLNMKLHRLALLASPALLAFVPQTAKVSFHPDEGATLEKTFEFELDMMMDDLSVMVDGMDMGGMLPIEEDPAINAHMTMVISDEYVGMGSGRPTELVREFKEMTVDYEATPGESGSESADDIEGMRVRFKWNDEDGGYDVTFADEDSDRDPEMLDSLGEDMDLRALLPESADVSEGDTWEVAEGDVAGVLMPGLDMTRAMGAAGAQDMPEEAAMIFDMLSEQIEAFPKSYEITCEYKGARDVDGTQIGAIQVKIEGTGEIDFSEVIMEGIAQQGGGEVDADISHADFQIELDGEGTLLWNLEAGHLHSFEMSTEMTLIFEAGGAVDAQGESHDFDAAIEFGGGITWTIETE